MKKLAKKIFEPTDPGTAPVAVSAMLTPVNYVVWPGSRGPTINGFPEPHLQELSMCYAKCILSGAVS